MENETKLVHSKHLTPFHGYGFPLITNSFTIFPIYSMRKNKYTSKSKLKSIRKLKFYHKIIKIIEFNGNL